MEVTTASAFGPVRDWPRSLQTVVSVCLNSRFPMVLWWGPDLRLIYNDAWRPSLGTKKHPAIGRPGREVWAEIWDPIGPMLAGVVSSGIATWSDDLMLPLITASRRQERYFTFTYSPLIGDSGEVEGVFCAVNETTDRVLGERRLKFGVLVEEPHQQVRELGGREHSAIVLERLARLQAGEHVVHGRS